MYAPQPLAVPAPVAMRLIGPLDAELVASFAALERAIGLEGGALIVDVRDLNLIGEGEMTGLVEAVRSARAQGRDVRLDAHGLAWRRLIKKNLSAQPGVDAEMRSDIRRTVILAHSGKRKATLTRA